MAKRSNKQYALLTLKGMAMGAADVVPGVSGGTIAFISGIYEELISTIDSINLSALRTLFQEGLKPFWKQINGTFLVFLFTGILFSIALLSSIVIGLLGSHPILVWSFFLGLIIASIWLVGKSITKWDFKTIFGLLVGTGVALWISSIQTVASVDANWYIILSGAIAICAMILPGISGSFILILLGSYHTVYGAIKEMNFVIIGLFGLGCIVGLLSFSKVLKYLFAEFKNVTIAILTGFMVGSIYKVWPWKMKIGSEPLVVHSDGREDYMMGNVFPSDYQGDSQLAISILCLFIGIALIIFLERVGPKKEK
ncbi:MAG: DUF368 domain-containing protein [Flavobacteriales bacterium]|nr:DUF368 domain-containing protein [Flavobacteriales bacterium]